MNSDLIQALDGGGTQIKSGLYKGNVANTAATATFVAGSISAGTVFRMVRLPINARILSIKISNTALGDPIT